MEGRANLHSGNTGIAQATLAQAPDNTSNPSLGASPTPQTIFFKNSPKSACQAPSHPPKRQTPHKQRRFLIENRGIVTLRNNLQLKYIDIARLFASFSSAATTTVRGPKARPITAWAERGPRRAAFCSLGRMAQAEATTSPRGL